MLKGKTIIELTDVNTGKKETYEDHNMVTQAINEIILKRKRYLYPQDGGGGQSEENYSSFYNMFPLYRRFFGGLMLFQNPIDESRTFLSGDDVVIGSATYGNAYSGLDPQIGSYNQTESEINTTEKYAKFVYDFATNQGNGTISAVCLGNYHYVNNCLYGKDYDGEYQSRALENLLYAQNGKLSSSYGNVSSQMSYKPQVCLFPTMLQTGSYQLPKGYEMPVVYDEEKGHLITVQFTSAAGTPSHNNVIDGIKLNVYDLGLNKCTLFGGFIGDYYKAVEPTLIYEKEFTIPTCGNYSEYVLLTNYCKFAYYDSDGCIYVLGDSKNTTASYWNANDVFTVFKFDLNVESYENIKMQTIEVTNKSGKTLDVSATWRSQSQTKRKILIKDGYLYTRVYTSSYNDNQPEHNQFVKIKITDSTDVSVIDTSANVKTPYDYNGLVCDCGDMIYIGTNLPQSNKTSCFIKLYNTKTGAIKYTRVKYGFSYINAKPVPIKGNNVYSLLIGSSYDSTNHSNIYSSWVGVFASRNDYLATINNLDTPVTKTSDKTMKITYVLQGE